MEWVVGGVAGSLFTYNRENFMFDSEQRLKREFQGQIMRIKKFELYREDVRDLMELTVSKMDNYLIINTLQLGFTIILFTEGRPAPGKSPPWLHWLYALTTVAAFLYFVLSVWLAMHASIAAHSFGVRLLTQFVRLPVPNKEQLDNARALATDYEAQGVGNLLRIPVLGQQLQRLNATMDTLSAPHEDDFETVPEPEANANGRSPTVSLRHTQLYRQVQANWQAYDAYARVCMAMGTNQLLHAMGYFCIGMLISENRAPFPALCCIVIFTSCAWLLVRLDLYISRRVLTVAGVLLFASPLMTVCSITIDRTTTGQGVKNFGNFLVPVSFLLHICWILFIVKLAKADNHEGVALPKKFRSVLYLDVFGWLSMGDDDTSQQPNAATGRLPTVGEGLRSRQVTEDSIRSTTLPPALRTTLSTFCRKMTKELRRDFDLWQNPGVRSVLEGDESTLHQIQGLRNRFDAIEARLRNTDACDNNADTRLPGANDGHPVTWLRLEWKAPGRLMDFWYRCDTGQTLCTKPKEGQRVLSLADTKNALDELADKADALCRFGSPGSGDDRAPPFGSLPLEDAGPSASDGDAEQRLRQIAERSTPPLLQNALSDEDDGPAQENRFGGREAVELAEGSAWRQTFFGHSAEAGASFHPHRQGNPINQANEPPRGAEFTALPQRTPGQIPWMTFLHGSYALVFVWFVGFLWSMAFCWSGIDIPLPPVDTMTGWARAATRPDLVHSGPWPHAFFTPRALACHTTFGPRLLLAETFGVHEVPLDIAGELGDGDVAPMIQPALADCLANSSDFHARGIRSISLKCEEEGSCMAILLATAGRETLHCNLVQKGAAWVSAGFDETRSTQFAVHGGAWRSLASANNGEHDGSVWALGDDSIANLRPRLGISGDLVPNFDLPHDFGNELEHVHVTRSAVVALQPSGRLYAWPFSGGGVKAWQLPVTSQWVGLCVIDQSLFLVGLSRADGSVAVWRTHLPDELHAADAL